MDIIDGRGIVKMDKHTALEIFAKHGFRVASEGRLGNDSGDQIKLENGAVVNIYDKGTFFVQGKNAAEVKAALQADDSSGNTQNANRNVFVVYGHDRKSRTELEALLRRWDFEPLILDQLPSEGQTIIEKLESTTASCSFGIVLATPDDEGFRAERPDEKQFRARQNVVLELGMLLSMLGRKKVAILIRDQLDMEKPSDISGLMYIPFKDSIDDAKVLLFKELNSAGYHISSDRL